MEADVVRGEVPPTQSHKREDAWYTSSKRDAFILRQLVAKDFKLKYRRSALGVVWSVLNPLLMMIVMSVVFSTLMRFSSDSIPSYPLYIILGNITFQLMSDSTSQGMTSIIGASSLLKKVRINRWVFPVEKVLFAMVNFAFSFVAVILVMVVAGVAPTPCMMLLPLWHALVGIFCAGLSLFLSTASVFFRDVIHLWGVVLTAWTYATPLFYTQELLPPWMLEVELANPMYHYVNVVRDLVLYGRMPNPNAFLACAFFALFFLALGYVVFRKNEHKFILYI